MFKKMIGDATYGQVSLFFSLIGLLNAALLWPVCLVLYFSEVEILHWDRLPWMILLSASTLSLGTKQLSVSAPHCLIILYTLPFSVANLLGNLSVAFTYDIFITFGLITAVPVSAGKFFHWTKSRNTYIMFIRVITPSLTCFVFMKHKLCIKNTFYYTYEVQYVVDAIYLKYSIYYTYYKFIEINCSKNMYTTTLFLFTRPFVLVLFYCFSH